MHCILLLIKNQICNKVYTSLANLYIRLRDENKIFVQTKSTMYNSRNFFLTEVCGANYQIIPSSLMGFSNALIYTTGTSTTLTSFVLGILPEKIHCQLHCTPCYYSRMVKARLGQYTASIEMWPHFNTFGRNFCYVLLLNDFFR